mgnify:FL=1
MERDFTSRSHHDMGGLEAGHIKTTEHDYELWEKNVDALMVLLTSKSPKLMSVDQLRKGIESLPPDAYEKMSYYERWIFSITQALQYNGVLTTNELSRKLKEVQTRYERDKP